MGSCRYGEECTYIHGDLCELCSQHCLHPTDEVQRLQHNQVRKILSCHRVFINSFFLFSGLFASTQIGHGKIFCRCPFSRQGLRDLHGDHLGEVAFDQATFRIAAQLLALLLVTLQFCLTLLGNLWSDSIYIDSLDCIRKWRQEKQFENKIIRSCPECRVQSDFVCPSRYWCETKEEKEKLITDYKKALR